jgi:hypothetical protein
MISEGEERLKEENRIKENIPTYMKYVYDGNYYDDHDYHNWLISQGLTQLDILLLHPSFEIKDLQSLMKDLENVGITHTNYVNWVRSNQLIEIKIEDDKIVIPEKNYVLKSKINKIKEIIKEYKKITLAEIKKRKVTNVDNSSMLGGGKKSRKAKKSLRKRKTNKNKKTNRRRRR